MPSSHRPQKFHFSQKLLHLRQRGVDIHPHLPDNCPLDSNGLPTFQFSINHLIPDQSDKRAILKFMGLNDSTIQQVLNLYEHDTESHDRHGEAVFDGYMYRFPLAIRLLELYAWRDPKVGSHEDTYDGYILAGIQLGGLSSEFAIWCGLSKDDPRYDEELMSFWYQMAPEQYALEIVEDNTCMLERLWREGYTRGRKHVQHKIRSNQSFNNGHDDGANRPRQ